MYCWRCEAEMPMLDEEEFATIDELYRQCMTATKDFRREHDLPLEEVDLAERFRPVREAYERLTGFSEMNHNAIMHHRISIYGPPCPRCGKPLRTPRAKLCAACGWRRAL